MGGVLIVYVEIDGVVVCIFDDGQWCECELGYEGVYVVVLMIF